MAGCCRIRRMHGAVDAIIPPVPIAEKVAGGFAKPAAPFAQTNAASFTNARRSMTRSFKTRYYIRPRFEFP